MSFRRLENTVKKTAGLTSKLGSSKFQTGPNSQRVNMTRKSRQGQPNNSSTSDEAMLLAAA